MSAAFVIVVAILVLGGVLGGWIFPKGRRLIAEIGNIKLTVDEVNNAVNHKPEGAPTLYQHAETAASAVLDLQATVARNETKHETTHELIDTRLEGIEGKLDGIEDPHLTAIETKLDGIDGKL